MKEPTIEETIRKHVAEVQEKLDGITRNGFWFGVYGDGAHVVTLLPHAIEVLGSRPVLGDGGRVTGWRDAILVIDRGFAEVGVPMHAQHLHVIDSIEWIRAGGGGEIYAAKLSEAGSGQTFVMNEIDAGEDPDEAAAWRAHVRRLDATPDRVAECLATIRAEFGAMVSGGTQNTPGVGT